MTARPRTPDRRLPDGTVTITMQRACNGCGAHIGDATGQETALAVAGQPLPDARTECPTCGPTAPPPACRPLSVVSGDASCLESECDHPSKPGSDLCDRVGEAAICGTHSEISGGGQIVRAVMWPCTPPTAPAAV